MFVHHDTSTAAPPGAHRSGGTRRTAALVVASLTAMALTAAVPIASAADDTQGLGNETTLYDFQDGQVPAEIGPYKAQSSIVGDDDKKMRVDFEAEENFYSSFAVRPDPVWDWSQQDSESIGIAMELTNPGDRSIQLIIDLASTSGVATRSVNVPAGGGGTYYFDVDSPALDLDSGLRADPSWLADKSVNSAVWMWGSKETDTSHISQLTFYVAGLLHDRSVVVDDIRVVRDAPGDPDYLTGLVDEFGQNAKVSYEGKISKAAEIRQQRVKEAKDLRNHPVPSDRSSFGGWAYGPRLEATGNFRVEKYEGRWTLVDPEGYLYFSTGIDNARMFDSPTTTGYDFDHDTLQEFPPPYLTAGGPEDLNRVQKSALPTRHEISDVRTRLFSELPDYSSSAGEHFGYTPETLAGPVSRGETYSFYKANVDRKYPGSDSMESWRENTVDRMLSWGFTSFGNWTDPEMYDNGQIPYFAHGWINGDFKTVSTGQDYWGPMPDPFDPAFADAAAATAQAVADEVDDSPYAIGVFMDNELSWGNTDSFATHYGIVSNTLGRDAATTPAKAAFADALEQKYESIGALNDTWGTMIPSWTALRSGNVDLGSDDEAKREDYSALLTLYAEKYFATVDTELDRVMPDHLYAGSRFASWGRTPEVVEAAAKYVDIMSYNEYREGLHPDEWAFLEDIDMPSLIGEFHMGTTTSGQPHPGLISAGSQSERADMYAEYMEQLIDNPYMVGGHWFQYADSPVTGRSLDGENYNIGFVSVTDRPYPEMVSAAREINEELYDRRFGDLHSPDAWNQDRTYTTGEQVTHRSSLYLAGWWTRGDEPGTSTTGAWQEIVEDASGRAVWTPSRVFTAGDSVVHQGVEYDARWWTRNQEPGKSNNGPWVVASD